MRKRVTILECLLLITSVYEMHVTVIMVYSFPRVAGSQYHRAN